MKKAGQREIRWRGRRGGKEKCRVRCEGKVKRRGRYNNRAADMRKKEIIC